jgi:alpha-tubulin suppressor-like RCC1 family protein
MEAHIYYWVFFYTRPFRKLVCGGEYTMAIDTRGTLYSWGSPEYGQLGHNDDGKYFVTASKMSFQFVTTPQRIERFVEKDPKEKSAKVSWCE